MNGVEILSSEAVYSTLLPEWWFVVGFLLTLIIAGIGVCCIARYDNASLVCTITCCVCFVLALLGLIPDRNNVHHIEYKVTIDDSVSMNEFLDKYEILDQEGKIYTVRERE